jgi:hypothetical protein
MVRPVVFGVLLLVAMAAGPVVGAEDIPPDVPSGVPSCEHQVEADPPTLEHNQFETAYDSVCTGVGAGPLPVETVPRDLYVSATVTFEDPASGTWLPCKRCYVEVWDKDDLACGKDDFLAWHYTDYSGFFNTYVTDDDCSGGQDLYLLADTRPSTLLEIVQNSGVKYQARTLVWDSCGDPCSFSGDQAKLKKQGDGSTDVDQNTRRALHIWNGIVAADVAMVPRPFTVRPVRVVYQADGAEFPDCATSGSHTAASAHYHLASCQQIHLGADKWAAQTAAHEWAHHLMHAAYAGGSVDDTSFYGENVSPPPGYGGANGQTSEWYAWKEGWADFVSMVSRGSSTYDYPSVGPADLETRTCTSACNVQSGDTVRMNVAASLWDLYDSASDGSETVNHGVGNFLTALRRGNNEAQDGFAGFYTSWKNANLSGADFRNAAGQNTINYT